MYEYICVSIFVNECVCDRNTFLLLCTRFHSPYCIVAFVSVAYENARTCYLVLIPLRQPILSKVVKKRMQFSALYYAQH
jgi:hypothetical protein